MLFLLVMPLVQLFIEMTLGMMLLQLILGLLVVMLRRGILLLPGMKIVQLLLGIIIIPVLLKATYANSSVADRDADSTVVYPGPYADSVDSVYFVMMQLFQLIQPAVDPGPADLGQPPSKPYHKARKPKPSQSSSFSAHY